MFSCRPASVESVDAAPWVVHIKRDHPNKESMKQVCAIESDQ